MNSPDRGHTLSRRSLLRGIASFALAIPTVLSLAGWKRAGKKFDPRFEIAIDVEIAAQDGFRVRRPYVAVWIEDLSGKPIRTLCLWMELGRKGPKYLRDLRRWYRDELTPSQVDGGDLVQTVSSPTREAGKYSLVWDGKDDKGRLVDQGQYVLCIEAARQHGTYQLITQPLKVETHPFKQALAGNIEIKAAAVELRKRK
jgi:hypothetical protein